MRQWLRTMHQPFDRISSTMVALLLEVVAGALHTALTMPAELVGRQSA